LFLPIAPQVTAISFQLCVGDTVNSTGWISYHYELIYSSFVPLLLRLSSPKREERGTRPLIELRSPVANVDAAYCRCYESGIKHGNRRAVRSYAQDTVKVNLTFKVFSFWYFHWKRKMRGWNTDDKSNFWYCECRLKLTPPPPFFFKWHTLLW